MACIFNGYIKLLTGELLVKLHSTRSLRNSSNLLNNANALLNWSLIRMLCNAICIVFILSGLVKLV